MVAERAVPRHAAHDHLAVALARGDVGPRRALVDPATRDVRQPVEVALQKNMK